MPKQKSAPAKVESGYTAKDIYVLQGLDPVRRRPGMYIGSTGPEGLHHLVWECVDNSLTHKTPVLIEKDGKIVLEPIGELIDSSIALNKRRVCRGKTTEILRSGFNIKTLSFDPATLKLSWQPVSSLIRHKVNSEILEVTLQNGRKAEITPYHSLFTLSSGEVMPIRGSELQIGSYVVIPKTFIESEQYVTELNLLEEFKKLTEEKTKQINLYNVRDVLTGEIKSFVKVYARQTGLKQNIANILNDYRRYDYFPFNAWRLLPEELQKRFRGCVIGNKGKKDWSLPVQFPINKEVVELLGIYAAEGSSFIGDTNRIVFSFGVHEQALIDYTRSLIRKTFNYAAAPHYVHETATTVQIDSLTLALLFREVLRVGGDSHQKQVPNLIFNLPSNLRERYLIAYLAGDGYPTKVFTKHLIVNSSPTQDERFKFTAISVSKNFIEGLSYLLFTLDKTFSHQEINQKRKGKISVNYRGRKTFTQFRRKTHSWRIDFYWNTNASYVNRLPVQETISAISWKRPYSFSLDAQGGISSAKITTLLEAKRITVYPQTCRFLNSDLGVVKVIKIRKIKYRQPWVYDFSVLQSENFVAGSAPIVCHNSIDEAMAGYAKNIQVVLMPQNRVKTVDDGRGIPVEKHPQTKKSALETVMTTLHKGAKFGSQAYKISGGLHGVGVAVVCALSKWSRAEVCRDGYRHFQEYAKGKPTTPVKKDIKCKDTGTTVIFEPDPEIFPEIKFDVKKITTHLRQQAYLTKGIRINIIDEREKPSKPYTFYFEGGLQSYVKYLVHGAVPIQQNVFYVANEKDGIAVEAAFQYTRDREFYEESFANNIHTGEGGTHVTGLRGALTRSLNDYARKNSFLKEKDENLTGEDLRDGFTGVISVKLREPQFEGQTKAKLGNPEVKSAVETVVLEGMTDFLERNPQDARAIIETCLLSAKARKAAKAARQTVLRKGALDGLALPGKLADCSSRDPVESELFIVEGDSAGGSCKMGRNRAFQAILPLRGKILNIERARLDKMLASKEIRALIIALGTAIGEDFNLENLRYHRIILTLDADVDGSHIRTLLLTLFYRHFQPIIEGGHLFIAQPPLYRIQLGKRLEYAYNEEDRIEIASAMKKEAKGNPVIQRYKGLGEMNPEQLWETTMNPENRILLQVRIEDAREADRVFDVLMGDDVLPRKKFIQAHAKKVRNLDI